MWPFSNKDDKNDRKIKELSEDIEYLNYILDESHKEIIELKKQINSDFSKVYHDFNFDSVYKVISIELQQLNYTNELFKCAICYMLIEPIIAGDTIKTEPVYKEWFCICTLDQYNFLYNKYLEYKKEVYNHE